MMSDAELGELAQDIQENGLQQPIIILRDNEGETRGESGPYPTFLLDGRNRLEALKRLGVTDPSKTPGGALYSQKVRVIDLHMQTTLGRGAAWEAVLDPVTFVLSMNVKRRHLTREQKRAILAASIKAEPALSDRQHAKRAGVSDKTAGAVRRELESTAEIPQSDSRVSGDGRTRRKPEKNNVVELSPDELAERDTLALQALSARAALARVAIGRSTSAALEKFAHIDPPADVDGVDDWELCRPGDPHEAHRPILARKWRLPQGVGTVLSVEGDQVDTGEVTHWYAALGNEEVDGTALRCAGNMFLEAADELERRQAQ
jgi:ParB-like chromosome segregation protein Spo0J